MARGGLFATLPSHCSGKRGSRWGHATWGKCESEANGPEHCTVSPVWAPLSRPLPTLGWMSMIRWSTKGHPLGSLCSVSSSYGVLPPLSTKQVKPEQRCTDSKQTPPRVPSAPPSGTKRSPAGRNHRKQAAGQEGSQTMWHPPFLPQEEPPPPPSVELINATWLDYSQMGFRNLYNHIPLSLLICDRKQIFLHGQNGSGSSPHHNTSTHYI